MRLTTFQHSKLLTEIAQLEKEIPELSARVEEAKKLGDLSENAEYSSANDDLNLAQGSYCEKMKILTTCDVIDDNNKSDVISVGSVISILEEGPNSSERVLVVSDEGTTITDGVLNTQTLLGRKILGSTSGRYTIQIADDETITYLVKKLDGTDSNVVEPLMNAYPDENTFFKKYLGLDD